MAGVAKSLSGFNVPFLERFAKERQAQANELQRQAAKAQREADTARKMVKRMKRGGTGGDEQRP
jgi:hypothetical protein